LHAENIAFDKWPVSGERERDDIVGVFQPVFGVVFGGKRGRSRGHGIGRRNCNELTNGRHHHHHHQRELKWAQPQNWNGIQPGYMFSVFQGANPPNYKLLLIADEVSEVRRPENGGKKWEKLFIFWDYICGSQRK